MTWKVGGHQFQGMWREAIGRQFREQKVVVYGVKRFAQVHSDSFSNTFDSEVNIETGR